MGAVVAEAGLGHFCISEAVKLAHFREAQIALWLQLLLGDLYADKGQWLNQMLSKMQMILTISKHAQESG